MVDGPILLKFRDLTAAYHAASGSAADAERRLSDTKRHVFLLREERKRLAAKRYMSPVDKAEHAQKMARVDAAIADAEAEIARLAGAHERLQARRDDANALACRCRDFLMEQYGLTRAQVEF